MQEFSLLHISLCFMSPVFWSRFILDVWHLPENLDLLNKLSHSITDFPSRFPIPDFPSCYNCNFYGSVLVIGDDKYRTFNVATLFLLQGLNNPHWWKFTDANIFNSKGDDCAFYIQNWFSLIWFVVHSSPFNNNLVADLIWITSGGRDK